MVGILGAVATCFFRLTPPYLSEIRGVMQENEADVMNFVAYIFLLPIITGRLSDMFPHRMDLARIVLPGVNVGCPAMFGMSERENYWGLSSWSASVCPLSLVCARMHDCVGG